MIVPVTNATALAVRRIARGAWQYRAAIGILLTLITVAVDRVEWVARAIGGAHYRLIAV
jgi:hypothetical protein